MSPARLSRRRLVATAMAVTLVATLSDLPYVQRPAAAAPPTTATAAECPNERPDEASAAVTARLCNKPIEVTNLTTETDQTFANANGSFEWKHSYRAKRLMRNGAWVPVDPTLVFAADGSVVPKATKADMRFSGGGDGPLVVMTVNGEQRVELDSPLGPLPKPVLKGATATYHNVLVGVDLEVTADVDGYTQVLVVKNREAARNPRLAKLEFATRTTGLSFQADEHANVSLVDATGTAVLRGTRPRLWDDATAKTEAPAKANGHVRTKAMPLEVSAGKVVVTPDPEVLDDPDTVYPVRIDPSMSLGVGNWALVFSDDPWGVYYNPAWDAQSGTWNAGGQVARTFFEMWPNEVLAGKYIESATFNIWETWSYNCNPRPVELWWTRAINGGTSWNTQPEWLEYQDAVTAAKGYNGNCPQGNLSFNVTSLIQRAADGNWPQVTVGLISPHEWDSQGWKRYDPNANISVVMNRAPQVTNRTTSPPTVCVTGPNRPAVNTKTPTLQTTVADADPGSQIRARFEVREVGQATNLFTHESGFGPTGSVHNITIPTDRLIDGRSYMWRTTADDGVNFSADGMSRAGWSQWCEFSVDTTPPGAPWVSSALYPSIATDNTWGHGGAGQAGQFTFRAAGNPDSPAGVWSLNEGTGTTSADSSGNGRNLSLSGGAGWASGQAGSALALNGVRTALLPATGVTQSISGRGGRCLDINGANPNNAATIHLWDCHGGWNQVWQPEANGSLRNPQSGRCLDLAGYGSANFTQVQLWDCTGAWNQVWQRQSDGGLRNPQSGRCLDAIGAGTTNGTNIILYDCWGGWNQHWQPQANGSLVSARPDQCIDVYNNETVNGTKIENWNCNGGGAQFWQWQPNHSLRNPQSGRCMDVQGGGTANGTLVQLYDCNGSGSQVWEPQPDGSLKNPQSGRCLDAATEAVNGRQLVIGDCVSWAVNQKWADSFNTANAQTSNPVLNTAQSFSVSAWVRPNKIMGGWPTAVSVDGEYTSPFGIGLDDNGLWTMWAHNLDSNASGLYRATATAQPVANSWVQLIGVYNAAAGTLTLYINGVAAGTATGVPVLYNATGGLTVGRLKWNSGPTGYFHGDVDDVRVYARALTAAQVAGTDTVAYRYQIDGGTGPIVPVDIPATGEASVSITPVEAGRRTLTAWTKDRSNNLSNPTTYIFNVGAAGMSMPAAGATVVKRMKLAVSADPTLTHARFQYRRGPGGAEYDVPLANLRKADGSPVTAYPVPLADLGTNAIWDAVDTLGSTGGVVQVRTQLYTGTSSTPSVATDWITTTVDPDGDGAASASVGPGSVNLLTGDYSLSSTDVDEFGLAVGRVSSSREPTDGWLPQGQRISANTQQVAANAPAKAAGVLQSAAWATVTNQMTCDFDGDGKQDIIGRNGDDLLLWRSTSNSTDFSFAPYHSFGSGWNTPTLLPMGDYDGDGKPDIAGISGNDLYIHRNTSTVGNPSKAGSVFVSGGWSTVTDHRVVDFDGDGKADIIGRGGDQLLLWRSTSTATGFSFAPYYSLGSGWGARPTLLPPADFDGDNKPDLAAFDTTGDQLYVHRNTSTPGNPSKAAEQFQNTGWASVIKSSITVADYDNDGRRDIIGRSGDDLLLWRSSSTAASFSFLPSFNFGNGWGGYGRYLTADYNGDAKPDIGAYSNDNASFMMHRNTSLPEGFDPATATITKVSDHGHGSTKNSLRVAPSFTDNDTYASIGADSGGMRLGMQAGKRYRATGWIYVPAATGLSPANANRGLRIVAFYKDTAGYHELASTAAAWVDAWQELTVDMAIPTGATEAFIRLYNGNTPASGKVVYWDNLSVTELVAPFGPQWRGGTGGGPADNVYASLAFPAADLAKITTVAGDTLTFGKNTTTGEFFPQPGAEHLTLAKINDTTYRLTNLDGTVVEFGLQGSTYPVTATWTSDGPATTTTRYLYDTTDSRSLTKRVINATEPGVGDCTTAIPARGCEVLEYEYATATSPGLSDSVFGDYLDRVRAVKFWTWDPVAQAETAVEVVRYSYDSDGRLRQVWDPRGTPQLTTSYEYVDGRVSTLTTPGELPWMFDYGSIAAEPGNTGRLHRVRRASLVQGSASQTGPEAVTRIVYQVPLTLAGGGPHDMNAAAIATWGQNDLPTDATAVFEPEDNPGVVQATQTQPGADGYRPATVHYLNASSQEINTAAPHPAGVTGASIDSVQFDQFGNTVWTLEATNRLLALGQHPDSASILSDLELSTMDSAQRAHRLATINRYSPDGLDLLETTGPTVKLILESALPDPDGTGPLLARAAGTPVVGRARSVTAYDENKPDGAAYHLPTTKTTSAAVAGYPDTDVRMTRIGYAAEKGGTSGWQLKRATSTTVDAGPGGNPVTTYTTYDTTGRETTAWGVGANGSDARTVLTTYYAATANAVRPECGNHPEWAGLPCVTRVGGAITGQRPDMTSDLTETRVESYNRWGDTLSLLETAAGKYRRTIRTYDTSARVSTVEITSDESVVTPSMVTTYSPTSGKVATVTTGDGVLTRDYDLLGRQYKYTDADGGVTQYEFNQFGSVVRITDNTGWTNYTYDRTLEPRGLLTSMTDSTAGTFTMKYSADGKLTELKYPGGLTRTDTLNTNLEAVGRTYTRDSDGAVIYAESAVENSHSQRVTETYTGGSQTYGYDRQGRLVKAEQVSSGVCTTRTYVYDQRTNRGDKHTFNPAVNGSCRSDVADVTEHHTYDSADRLTDTGYSYDAFGRTVTAPGGMINAYYSIGPIASQTAGETRRTWTIYSDQRTRRATTETLTGGVWATTATTLNHYGDDTDRPRWISENGTAVTRYVSGPGEELLASTSATGDVLLHLTDLHSNVVVRTNTALTTLQVLTFDEFGLPAPGQSGQRYGWLGGKQRSSEAFGDIVLMGVRLYSATLGRFLQVDPVPGGNATAYDYCFADPINCTDLDGRWSIMGGLKKLYNNASNISAALGVAAMIAGPFCPPCGVVLGFASLAFGLAGAVKDFRDGKPVAGALTLVGAIPGAGAFTMGARAVKTLITAKIAKKGLDAAHKTIKGAIPKKQWRKDWVKPWKNKVSENRKAWRAIEPWERWAKPFTYFDAGKATCGFWSACKRRLPKWL